jgi:hypothetical protein
MNLLKLGLAVFCGVVLGAALFHAPRVKANAQEPGTVHVAIIPITVLDAKNIASQNIPGYTVTGISCLSKPVKQLPDAAVCYVATTPN